MVEHIRRQAEPVVEIPVQVGDREVSTLARLSPAPRGIEARMFTTHRAGLKTIFAIATLIVLYVMTVAVLLQSYSRTLSPGKYAGTSAQ